jgi:hypothetical protein
MVEHDEARQDPQHEEAHIARLVACERHAKAASGTPERRAAVARGGSSGLHETRRAPCPVSLLTTSRLQLDAFSARMQRLYTMPFREVREKKSHLKWVLCSVLPVVFAATSGVCLIRSGAAGFQKKLHSQKKSIYPTSHFFPT